MYAKVLPLFLPQISVPSLHNNGLSYLPITQIFLAASSDPSSANSVHCKVVAHGMVGWVATCCPWPQCAGTLLRFTQTLHERPLTSTRGSCVQVPPLLSRSVSRGKGYCRLSLCLTKRLASKALLHPNKGGYDCHAWLTLAHRKLYDKVPPSGCQRFVSTSASHGLKALHSEHPRFLYRLNIIRIKARHKTVFATLHLDELLDWYHMGSDHWHFSRNCRSVRHPLYRLTPRATPTPRYNNHDFQSLLYHPSSVSPRQLRIDG